MSNMQAFRLLTNEPAISSRPGFCILFSRRGWMCTDHGRQMSPSHLPTNGCIDRYFYISNVLRPLCSLSDKYWLNSNARLFWTGLHLTFSSFSCSLSAFWISPLPVLDFLDFARSNSRTLQEPLADYITCRATFYSLQVLHRLMLVTGECNLIGSKTLYYKYALYLYVKLQLQASLQCPRYTTTRAPSPSPPPLKALLHPPTLATSSDTVKTRSIPGLPKTAASDVTQSAHQTAPCASTKPVRILNKNTDLVQTASSFD